MISDKVIILEEQTTNYEHEKMHKKFLAPGDNNSYFPYNKTSDPVAKFVLNKEIPSFRPLKMNYLREQVLRLQNLPQPEQRSKEWYEFRETMLTASDFGYVLDPTSSKYDGVLKKKVGFEVKIEGAAIDHGKKYEDVAIQIYEKRNNTKVLPFGCIRHPMFSFLGASPDGITADGVMVEIKCPFSRVIDGNPPEMYWCQVQGQLEVCDLERCDFLECCIREYPNREEYETDNFEGDTTRNKFGFEKGSLLAFYDERNPKDLYYEYGEIGFMGDDLSQWQEETTNKVALEKPHLQLFSPIYWYLDHVSCIPIFRNQEWFYTALPMLKYFWDDVLTYRELGKEACLNYLEVLKSERLKAKTEQKVKTDSGKKKTTVSRKKKETFELDSSSVNLDDMKSQISAAEQQQIQSQQNIQTQPVERKCYFFDD